MAAEKRHHADAWEIADQITEQVKREVIHGVKPSQPAAVACRRFLERDAVRRPGLRQVRCMQEIGAHFEGRLLRDIPDPAWIGFVAARNDGNQAATRERYLNDVLAFLNWCRHPARGWVDRLPAFERDAKARKPRHRQRRRVVELTPELIACMIDHAAPHLRPQLYVAWSTGWRVSSIIAGVRLCDVVLSGARSTITTHQTKNGDPVTASLHPVSAEAVSDYLDRRGRLHWREGPLFLTHRNRPYAPNCWESGTQNKTAFNGMKRRAVRTLRRRAAEARGSGAHAEAWRLWGQASLVAQVTQHWLRHLLATTMLGDETSLRTIMGQAGWRDVQSVLAYAHDVPEARRESVLKLDIRATPETRGTTST